MVSFSLFWLSWASSRKEKVLEVDVVLEGVRVRALDLTLLSVLRISTGFIVAKPMESRFVSAGTVYYVRPKIWYPTPYHGPGNWHLF